MFVKKSKYDAIRAAMEHLQRSHNAAMRDVAATMADMQAVIDSLNHELSAERRASDQLNEMRLQESVRADLAESRLYQKLNELDAIKKQRSSIVSRGNRTRAEKRKAAREMVQ